MVRFHPLRSTSEMTGMLLFAPLHAKKYRQKSMLGYIEMGTLGQNIDVPFHRTFKGVRVHPGSEEPMIGGLKYNPRISTKGSDSDTIDSSDMLEFCPIITCDLC